MSVLPIFHTLMNGLFGKSATTRYPLESKKSFDAARGHIVIDIGKCIFCGICSKRCPTGAIAVNRNEKTWSISRCDCIQCNCCAEACPKKCLKMDPQRPEAVIKIESHVVRSSASGETDA